MKPRQLFSDQISQLWVFVRSKSQLCFWKTMIEVFKKTKTDLLMIKNGKLFTFTLKKKRFEILILKLYMPCYNIVYSEASSRLGVECNNKQL